MHTPETNGLTSVKHCAAFGRAPCLPAATISWPAFKGKESKRQILSAGSSQSPVVLCCQQHGQPFWEKQAQQETPNSHLRLIHNNAPPTEEHKQKQGMFAWADTGNEIHEFPTSGSPSQTAFLSHHLVPIRGLLHYPSAPTPQRSASFSINARGELPP